jgi:hypothetical protein
LIDSVESFSKCSRIVDIFGNWLSSNTDSDTSSIDILVNDKSVDCDLDAVVTTINHTDSWVDTCWQCTANWVRSIIVTELDGKRSSDSKSVEGNLSSEKDGIVVTIVCSIILKIDSFLIG